MVKTVPSTNAAGETEQLHAEESDWTTFSHIHRDKLKIDWGLECRAETVGLEGRTGCMLFSGERGSFSATSPRARGKSKTFKWDYSKLRRFGTAKGAPTKRKGRQLNGRSLQAMWPRTGRFRGLVAKSRPTLATPRTVGCQVPLSLGFSRHEYWSGLPFPSPMHESEK